MALAPSLWWLFVGRVISGITAASISTGFAYVADVTPPEQRAARFGMLGVAFGAGFVLGPAIGGLAGAIDPRLPFWIAAGLEPRQRALWLADPAGVAAASVAHAVRVAARQSARRAQAVALASRAVRASRASTSSSMLAHAVLPIVVVLYMLYRYGWDERAVGFVLAGVGVCSMVVQGGLIGPAVKRFGERKALIGGLLFGAAGFFVYGGRTDRD